MKVYRHFEMGATWCCSGTTGPEPPVDHCGGSILEHSLALITWLTLCTPIIEPYLKYLGYLCHAHIAFSHGDSFSVTEQNKRCHLALPGERQKASNDVRHFCGRRIPLADHWYNTANTLPNSDRSATRFSFFLLKMSKRNIGIATGSSIF